MLPKKFAIDKRYAHLSDLINAGQISKELALSLLKNPPYPKQKQLEDLRYVEKKLGMRPGDFEKIMKKPIKSFRDYKNSYNFMQKLRLLINLMRKFGLYPK